MNGNNYLLEEKAPNGTYLHSSVLFEGKIPDFSALYNLKKLQRLVLLPRYLKSGQVEVLKKELPLIMNL